MEFLIDKGKEFGKWTDSVSKFMYHDHFASIYSRFNLDSYNHIEDLGGANGLLREFFIDKNYTTSDIDKTKEPNFIRNAIDFNGMHRCQTFSFPYQSDLIIIRYILHYLTDDEVIKMFSNIKKHHKGDILVIQFTNEDNDLNVKLANSINEIKYFRTQSQLYELLIGFNILQSESQSFEVTEEFYQNRLQNFNAKAHSEEIQTVLMR